MLEKGAGIAEAVRRHFRDPWQADRAMPVVTLEHDRDFAGWRMRRDHWC